MNPPIWSVIRILEANGYTKIPDKNPNLPVPIRPVNYRNGYLIATLGVEKINTYDERDIDHTLKNRTFEQFIEDQTMRNETITWKLLSEHKPNRNGWYLVTYRSTSVSMAKYPDDFENGDNIMSYADIPFGWIGQK